MAGAGYKLFNTGDVLTASDVNTYLQQQVVMVFASSAARSSALTGVLAEGMVTYLQDTNSVQVYNGTAFVAVGGSSPLTTKGDLYTFSTTDARLPVGTNGQILSANSAMATGLEFITPASGGGMTLISTTTLTGSSVTLSSIPGTFNNLQVVIQDFLPATGNFPLQMRFNADSTSNRHLETPFNTANNSTTAYGATEIDIGSSQSGSVAQNLTVVNIYNYANTTTRKMCTAESFAVDNSTSTSIRPFASHGFYNQTSAISSLEFRSYGNNFTSGTILLYGVK